MRALTLDEKITLKGIYKEKGVAAYTLARLTMLEALFLWRRLFGYAPISTFRNL